jgi:hypothetical protein
VKIGDLVRCKKAEKIGIIVSVEPSVAIKDTSLFASKYINVFYPQDVGGRTRFGPSDGIFLVRRTSLEVLSEGRR